MKKQSILIILVPVIFGFSFSQPFYQIR